MPLSKTAALFNSMGSKGGAIKLNKKNLLSCRSIIYGLQETYAQVLFLQRYICQAVSVYVSFRLLRASSTKTGETNNSAAAATARSPFYLLCNLQSCEGAKANNNLLHFHQRIFCSRKTRRLISDALALYGTGSSSKHFGLAHEYLYIPASGN